MKKIVFVCTGNTCRSPMAEGIFNALFSRNEKFYAVSCGISCRYPLPPSVNAVTAAQKYGADISGHVCTTISDAVFNGAHAVFCMTGAHVLLLRSMFPHYSDIVHPISSKDISDPFGGDLDLYIQTADEIYNAVKAIYSELTNADNKT